SRRGREARRGGGPPGPGAVRPRAHGRRDRAGLRASAGAAVKLGIVGCGAVAELLHLPATAGLVARDSIWLADPDRGRAAELARRFGDERHVVTDARELSGSVDAAIVATPNDTHAAHGIALLRRGVTRRREKLDA